MGVTISTHNGSAVRREHNVRNEKVVSKESHIDPNGTYEVWHDEKVRDAYERLFGQAVADYNTKQSREDRRIDNYYNNICKDAKKHPVYEMIIGVYGTNEDGVPLCSTAQGKEIMRKFVETWQERNPNLELIGAYYHADEQGEPHVHIDYIPVAHGYKNGMETQTGLVKALGEQGFVKQGKATAQIQWETRENAYLDNLCREYGLEVDHPKEQGREHVHTEQYKAQKELERTIDHVNDLDKHVIAQKREESRLKDDISRLRGERKGLTDLQAEKTGKTLLGTPRRSVRLDYEEYATLQRRARLIADIEDGQVKALERLKRAEKLGREAEIKLQDAREKVFKADRYLEDAKEKQEIAQKYHDDQKEYIAGTAQKMARQFMNDSTKALGAEKKLVDRMKAFMRGLKFDDGRTALEEFQEQEKAFQKSMEQAFEEHDWSMDSR